MKLRIVTAALCLLAACSSGPDKTIPEPSPGAPLYSIGTVEIRDPWSTGGIRNGAGAAYCTLVNTGTEPDTLLSVSSPACERTELHEMIEQDGMRKMRAVRNIVLPPSGSAVLKPGGTHIMLLSLHDTQRKGDTLALSLTFSRAGTTSVSLPVR